MNIKQLGNGASLLTTNHGDEVLYLNNEIAAGFCPIIGYFKTEVSCEAAAKYLDGVGRVLDVTQEEIEDLFLGELE